MSCSMDKGTWGIVLHQLSYYFLNRVLDLYQGRDRKAFLKVQYSVLVWFNEDKDTQCHWYESLLLYCIQSWCSVSSQISVPSFNLIVTMMTVSSNVMFHMDVLRWRTSTQNHLVRTKYLVVYVEEHFFDKMIASSSNKTLWMMQSVKTQWTVLKTIVVVFRNVLCKCMYYWEWSF